MQGATIKKIVVLILVEDIPLCLKYNNKIFMYSV